MLNADRYASLYGDTFVDEVKWLREVSPIIDSYSDLAEQRDYRNDRLDQLLLDSFTMTTYERVQMFEKLSYGDAGALLFSSGPSLSGVILNEAGSEEHKAQFYDYIKERRCRTFFAVTEPGKGSDAANLQSRLTDGRLSGKKWLVSNGFCGEIGVALFKTGDGPLATRAALLTNEIVNSSQIKRHLLRQYSLRGARLSYLEFDELPVPDEQLLGQHLNPCERGLFSMVRTFNKMRPCVVGLGIGYAQAVVDLLQDNLANNHSEWKQTCSGLNTILAGIRTLNQRAAKTADKEPDNTSYSSIAKIELDDLVKKIRPLLLEHIAQLDDPLFDHVKKFIRDSYAFDFMEGTHVIQKHNLINTLKRSNFVANW